VLFSDEIYFFVQEKHSRFVRIRKSERVGIYVLPISMRYVKHPKRCSGQF